MVTPLFLDLDQIIRLHGELIARYGGIDGTRDIGLLHSAIAMPQASYGGCASRARENGPTPAIRARVPPAALQGHRPCRSPGSRTRNRPATSRSSSSPPDGALWAPMAGKGRWRAISGVSPDGRSAVDTTLFHRGGA